MLAPQVFVKALQREQIPCPMPGCPGPVESCEGSQADDRVKRFDLRCTQCGWQELVTGKEELTPPWGEASLLAMADEHLLHRQPTCPYDQAPVIFTSLTKPRRKARYRIACFYCGRQAEIDWPPQESKW